MQNYEACAGWTGARAGSQKRTTAGKANVDRGSLERFQVQPHDRSHRPLQNSEIDSDHRFVPCYRGWHARRLEVHVSRSAADIDAVNATKTEINYRQPPKELVPARGPDYDGAAWDRLFDWFEANTSSATDAILIFLSEKANVTLSHAYEITDGWARNVEIRRMRMVFIAVN